MSVKFYTRHDIVAWMIEEAAADHNGLTIDRLTDETWAVTDNEWQERTTVTVSKVSKALTRWAKAVKSAPEDYCNYWVVAAAAVQRSDWDNIDYDATISTRVVQVACGLDLDALEGSFDE
ncbi:hypothetical protein [Corynebacterium variabile]|uniref:hypothetical protein n=1 Tax=Corynebacterium variabile TaxID=1727 RepID=UPI002898B5EF|nr:hypothetical protein [Corynebacterium variabile]